MNQAIADAPRSEKLAFSVLLAATVCHFFNDLMQSLFTATYPVLKAGFGLTFGQIGLLTLSYELSASVLQPLIGAYTDNRPQPHALAFGMAFSMAGLVSMALAPSYALLMMGGILLGMGSAIFHPEASRLARLASSGAHGLGQSIFQVGGNIGSSLGPLLVAFVILSQGRASLAGFALIALPGMVISTGLARWYQDHGGTTRKAEGRCDQVLCLSAKWAVRSPCLMR